MNKEEALNFIKAERLKEIEEFTEKLNSLCEEYNISLDVQVIVNPNGTMKKVIIVDNKKILQ